MAKKQFSEETKRKIAAKAREREKRKREAKAAGGPGTAMVIRDPNAPPPPPGGEPEGFSARTKKTIRDLLEVRVRAEASIADLKVKAKTVKEGADMAVQTRDTLVRDGLDKNTLDENFDKIRDLTDRRDRCLDSLRKTRNKIKAQKAIVAEALMKMDRAIAGEAVEGTIFDTGAKK